jgi:hypothetical protein
VYEAWTEDDLDNAIKKFQTDNDLPQKNGVLDDNTITAMKILHEPYRMI